MSEITSRLAQALVLEDAPTTWKDHHGGAERNSERTWATESSYSLSDLDESIPPTEDEEAVDATTEEQQSADEVKSSSKIRWGQVNVRLFQIMPGHHPDCLKGPPVRTIGDSGDGYTIT